MGSSTILRVQKGEILRRHLWMVPKNNAFPMTPFVPFSSINVIELINNFPKISNTKSLDGIFSLNQIFNIENKCSN